MTVLDDETTVKDMLAPLGRVEPVSLKGRKRRRPAVMIVSLFAAALIASGIAIAEGVNPFASIGAANHSRTPRDILDPKVVAQIEALNMRFARAGTSSGVIDPATSRVLGQVTGGRTLYVARTTNGVLCAVVTRRARLAEFSCGEGLTSAHPVTVTTTRRVKNGPHATPPLSYGITQDGITSVSFTAHGQIQTVAVKRNVWFYEGSSNVGAAITVHYENGTTRTISR